MIPIIRGNETGTGSYNSRKKRDVKPKQLHHEDPQKAEVIKEEQPVAKPSVPIGNSNILIKRKRFLRSVGLREVDVSDGGRMKRKVEPRQNNPAMKAAEEMKLQIESEYATRKRRWAPKYAHSRQKRSSFDFTAAQRMDEIMVHKESITGDNCLEYKTEELQLPGDVAYGADKQFSYQARTAVRLAHFLSNFLQNIDIYEEYGNLRGDKLLNIELIFGEVLANVMGDLKLKGSGVFYDIDKYQGPTGRTRQYFGPYAYRYDDAADTGGQEGEQVNTNFRAIDYAGFEDHYLDEPWFRNVKERWQSNTYGLTRFTEKPRIRSDLQGNNLKRFEMYPMYYRAPNETDGWWSAPYFDCDGYVNDWVITYSVPFFGRNTIGSTLEFK